MTKGYNTFARITLVFIVLTTILTALQSDSAHRLYLEAKKRSFNQQWDIAAQMYEQLVEDYPDSHYCEEAQFWVGYCREKTGDYHSAYLAFNTLERKFPQSTWLDDAIQHKIVLSEKLAARRGDQYYTFLRDQLDHQDKDIQYQAAMVLGRLEDRRALPVLKSLRGHVEFDTETETIIAALEAAQDVPDEAVYAEDAIGDFGENEAQSTRRFNPKDDRVNYFAEHRFEQYKAMTRQDDKWSEAELQDFGLWHILPSDSFDVYFSLNAPAKNEWLRKFWKKRDPTPTTDRNEEQEEFLYRVRFARETFSYYDGLDNFHYAPWDARGEIYIKFGKPEERTISDDGEFWYYPQHDRITFYIRPNVTNIFGRSIVISSLDGHSMRSTPKNPAWNRWRYMHTQYIFNPGFYYEFSLPRGQKLITELNVKQLANTRGATFRYSLPADEFDIVERDGLFHRSFQEHYIIFDNNMNKIAEHETTRRITKPTRRDLERVKTIQQDINLDLGPGTYMLGLHVNDAESRNVGIKKIDLNIK